MKPPNLAAIAAAVNAGGLVFLFGVACGLMAFEVENRRWLPRGCGLLAALLISQIFVQILRIFGLLSH